MRIVKNQNPFLKLLLPVFLAAPFLMHAQATQKITLNDAITKGLQESKVLRLDHSKIDIAIAKYSESKDAMLPDLKITAGYTYLSDLDQGYRSFQFGPQKIVLYENNNYTTRASVTAPIFVGFREKYAEKSAQLLLEASKLDVEKDKDDVTLNIINSYFNLYKAQSVKKQIEDNIGQIKQRLAEVQSGFSKGTNIQNDVLRVQLQMSNTQLAQIEAANNIGIINFNMDILLGLPVTTVIEVDSASMFAVKNLKTSDDYFKDAINQRQELKANKVRIEVAQNGINIAKGSYYPTIGIGADYYYSRPNQRYFPVLDEFKPTWDAGINLSWDVTNMFTNKHQIAEANANLMQSRIVNDLKNGSKQYLFRIH
jgi:outer membrane protein